MSQSCVCVHTLELCSCSSDTETGSRSRQKRYRERYLDRSSFFLPPSSYHMEDGECKVDEFKQTRPTCKTPLSLLFVATEQDEIHLLLHGRYLIAKLRVPHPTQMACTSDLTHLAVLSSSKPSKLNFFSMAPVATHRYSLQTIGALYCSIKAHIECIQESIAETLGSWKNALRPLDTKVSALKTTLKNYGAEPERLQSILLQYIAIGSTTQFSNALEQFFSGIQMNDQLLVRMEKSLYNAVANVETLARKNLLSPLRSLLFDVNELYGLDESLLWKTTPLQRACQIMCLSVEYLVSQIVEARFRIRDLVTWLRSVGSAIKAKGTAPNSVQNENARKRRASQAVIQRMASYFQEGPERSDSPCESVLGIQVSVSCRLLQ